MARKRSPGRRPAHQPDPEPHSGRGKSKDRNRHLEDARHHATTRPLPHPPHHTLKHSTGLRKHEPHTRPADEELNIDHGTHDDRPRPGKLMKEEKPVRKPRV